MEWRIVNAILNKVEASLVMWKRGQQGNRSLNLEEIEKLCNGNQSEILEEAMELEKEQWVNLKWEAYQMYLSKITFKLQDLPNLYNLVSREPKYVTVEKYLAFVEKYSELVETLWIKQHFKELKEGIQKGNLKNIKVMSDLEMGEGLFTCLLCLDKLREPILKRVFSKQVFRNSKTFELHYQKRILEIVKKHLEEIQDIKEELGDTQILDAIYIDTYGEQLEFKGELRIQLNDKVIDFSNMTFGGILNSETLKHAKILKEQKIHKIITIENRANFAAMPYEPGALIIFTQGFLSPKKRLFLTDLVEKLGKEVEYYHSGDLDYGGIMIYSYMKKRIMPNLKPYRMDRETYLKYLPYAEPISEVTLKRVEMLEEVQLRPLIECIIKYKKTIEQEAFLC